MMELQPVAPFRGQWQRGEEHETLLTLHCGPCTIELRHPLMAGNDLEYWLVETLHLWPHPYAPVSAGEPDYPNYRRRAYARLSAGRKPVTRECHSTVIVKKPHPRTV